MQRITTIFMCCVYALSVFSASGLVYCQGADGHSAIEPVHEADEHCAVTHTQHEDDHEESLSHEHPCEPCVDTPLQFEDHLVNKNDSQPTDSFAVVLVESSNFIENNFINSVQFPIPPPRLNSTLAHLRTVILLV